MPKNDREVFEHLIYDKETSLQIDFLAYAIFAHEKREWIRLYESQNKGQAPQQTEIDTWISNLTDSQFIGMRSSAEAFFVEAASAYFEERMEAERQEILRSAIVSEVKAAGALWKQIAIALLTAVLAPIVIGLIIAAFYFFDKSMLSPAAIARHFGPTSEQGFVGGPPPGTPSPASQTP